MFIMAGLKLDKNNTGFSLLPEGEYEVYPTVFAKETAKTTGNKMAQFNYTVRDDVDQEGKGQEVRFDNFVESDGALWRINQASDAAGLDMDKEYDSVWDWAGDFVNKAVRIVVGHREYNGRTFPEVKEFKPSLYGGEYVAADKPAAAGATTAKAAAEPIDISDDDLPF